MPERQPRSQRRGGADPFGGAVGREQCHWSQGSRANGDHASPGRNFVQGKGRRESKRMLRGPVSIGFVPWAHAREQCVRPRYLAPPILFLVCFFVLNFGGAIAFTISGCRKIDLLRRGGILTRAEERLYRIPSGVGCARHRSCIDYLLCIYHGGHPVVCTTVCLGYHDIHC